MRAEREIVTAAAAFGAAYWEGYNAAAVGKVFNPNRSQAWSEGYRAGEKDRTKYPAARPSFEIDTSAEDERLDDPRHEGGSNR